MAESPYFKSDDPADKPLPKAGGTSWFLYGLLGVAALVLVFMFLRGGQQRARGTTHPAVGKTLERLQLDPLTGDAPKLELASLQGKVTVVNFWGTWCPPCREEFPHIVALANEFENQPSFQLAAVSCEAVVEKDIDRLREVTEQYLYAAKADMPTYYDPRGITRVAVNNVAGEFAYPTTIVFDRQGNVAGYWLGYIPGTEQEISELVRTLLAKP